MPAGLMHLLRRRIALKLTLALVGFVAVTLLIGGSEVLGALFQGITYGLGVAGFVLALIWKRTRPHVYSRVGGMGQDPVPAATTERSENAHD